MYQILRQVWSLLFKWNWKLLWFKANFKKFWVSNTLWMTLTPWASFTSKITMRVSQDSSHGPLLSGIYEHVNLTVSCEVPFVILKPMTDLRFVYFVFCFFYFDINFLKWKMRNSKKLLPQLPWATAWLYHFVRVWFVHSQLNPIAGRKDGSWVGTKAKQ